MLFEPPEQGLCCRLGLLNTNCPPHPIIWRLLLWGRKGEARGQSPCWAWEREQYPDNQGHQRDAAVRTLAATDRVVSFGNDGRKVLGFSEKSAHWVCQWLGYNGKRGFYRIFVISSLILSLSALFNLCESWGKINWERLNYSSPHHRKNADWSFCSVLRYFLEEVTLHFMTSWLWSTSVQQSSSGAIQLLVDGLLSVLQFHKNHFTARLKRNQRGPVWSMATLNQVSWLLHQVEINYSLLFLKVVFLVSRRWVTYPGILCNLQTRDCLKAVVKIILCFLSRHWKQSRNTPSFMPLQTLALQ